MSTEEKISVTSPADDATITTPTVDEATPATTATPTTTSTTETTTEGTDATGGEDESAAGSTEPETTQQTPASGTTTTSEEPSVDNTTAPDTATTESSEPTVSATTVTASAGPVDPNGQLDGNAIKLFVGQLPRSNFSEDDLRKVLQEYGNIHELTLLKSKDGGMNKGCAFVTYFTHKAAEQAMAALHDQKILPGMSSPMQVKLAEAEENRKLFIGMFGQTTSEQLAELFKPYSFDGELEDITILRNKQDGSSKGCGFLSFKSRNEAEAAVNALHEKVTLEGNIKPLIVKFAETEKDKRAKRAAQQQQQTYMQQQMYNQYNMMAAYGYDQNQIYQYQQQQVAQGAYGAYAAPQQQQQQVYSGYGQQQQGGYGQQQQGGYGQAQGGGGSSGGAGPEGANLFIYHLPQSVDDAQLQECFAPFGNVVSAKVFVDKATGQSKCFGFVSYDNAVSANSAIQNMNGYQIGNKRLKVSLKKARAQSKPY